MSLHEVKTIAFKGIEVITINVQIQINNGVPQFTIVGLADKTIAESKERVKSALISIGMGWPAKRIVINLSPANIEKEGNHFDLPIALAIMASNNIIPKDLISNYIIMGELSLNATILPVNGVLPAAINGNNIKKGIICPYDNKNEAYWSGNQDILTPKNLFSLINHFSGSQILTQPEHPKIKTNSNNNHKEDINEVIGNESAIRALEITAAGRHNLLMFGPPGSGKSMLASRLATILPDINTKEILENTIINSIAGLTKDQDLISEVPFRAPHHSCSVASLVGGGMGSKVKPGEISLAHNGILFLDELPEFNRNALEALRQPIETGKIIISRVNNNIEYPANFQLIAAMNPCKCGYISDPERACNKAPQCGKNYLSKISGPLLDRFDIAIEVPATYNFKEKKNYKINKSSKEIKEKVILARKIQEKRFNGLGIKTNNQMTSNIIRDYAILKYEAEKILNDAANKFKFSMRGYYRTIKLARTIADVDNSKNIDTIHISESINYRIIAF